MSSRTHRRRPRHGRSTSSSAPSAQVPRHLVRTKVPGFHFPSSSDVTYRRDPHGNFLSAVVAHPDGTGFRLRRVYPQPAA